jgi:hypothetical protein
LRHNDVPGYTKNYISNPKEVCKSMFVVHRRV